MSFAYCSKQHVTFLVPSSAPRVVTQRPWYVLSCLWDGAYKRTLAANRSLCRAVEPAKAGTHARDRRALQQLALNVYVEYFDLT